WQALNRERQSPYEVLEQPPESLLQALQAFIAEVGEQLTAGTTAAGDPAAGAPASGQTAGLPVLDADVQRFYFDAIRFCRMAETFDQHSFFDCTLLAGPV